MPSSPAAHSTHALPTSRLTRSMSSIMQISDTEQSQSPHPAVSRSRKEENRPLSKALVKGNMVLERYDSLDAHEECTRKFNRIKRKFDALSDEHSKLCIAHTELEKSHKALIKAVGQRLSPDNVPSVSPAASELSSASRTPDLYLGLTRANAAARFPSIALWDQQDYKKAKKVKRDSGDILRVGESKPLRGSARMNEGENVMLDFIELDNGTIVDGNTAKVIRDELRSVYNELRKKDLLPKTWGAIGITARTFVFSHIYAKFPYLLLCHNDWKIIAIAGPVLSQWWNAENKRLSRRDGVAIKTEEDRKPQVKNANVNKRGYMLTSLSIDRTKAFGAPVGPAKSSDSSSQPQAKLVNQRVPRRRAKEVAGIAAETRDDNDGSVAAAGHASGNVASTSTSATAGFKKPTQSNAPKNLYYQEYLKEHPAITPAAFEMHWKGLPKDTQKYWAEVSRSKKAALASVGNGKEVTNN
ncbi:hypothetical protein BDZ97DRAFT_1951671 [Flammula alnicola]|nr:hypothetical protein BDZ97DRAFT_1951671 [Flammula alnicola]